MPKKTILTVMTVVKSVIWGMGLFISACSGCRRRSGARQSSSRSRRGTRPHPLCSSSVPGHLWDLCWGLRSLAGGSSPWSWQGWSPCPSGRPAPIRLEGAGWGEGGDRNRASPEWLAAGKRVFAAYLGPLGLHGGGLAARLGAQLGRHLENLHCAGAPCSACSPYPSRPDKLAAPCPDQSLHLGHLIV